MTEYSSVSDPSIGYNPILNFKPQPIKFGVYRLRLSIGTMCDIGSIVDISEYFGQAEWEELDVIDQHNWLDSHTQDWANGLIRMGWELAR